LVEGDAGNQFLEALPAFGGAAGPPQVGVNDLNGIGLPAVFLGALAEGVLEFQALLVGERLVGAGLANVNDGLATEMRGSDIFGCVHGLPPCRWWRCRR